MLTGKIFQAFGVLVEGRNILPKRFVLSKPSNEPEILGIWGRSGRVLDSRPSGRGFEPHRRHCVVVLEQDTFMLV